MEEKTERMDDRHGDLCPQFSARTHRNGTIRCTMDHDSRSSPVYSVFYHTKRFLLSGRTRNRRQTLLLSLLAIIGVLINAGITWHYMRLGAADGTSISFADSFTQGISMIFGMGSLPASMAEHHGTEFVLFWFSWGCILAAILCAVRPWIQKQAHGSQEIQHARTLLNLYSQNPCSYLTLEDDKILYFGKQVDGVIPYGIVGDTVVVNGDPVCKDEDFPSYWMNLRNSA